MEIEALEVWFATFGLKAVWKDLIYIYWAGTMLQTNKLVECLLFSLLIPYGLF